MLNHFLTKPFDGLSRRNFYKDNRFVLLLWVLVTLIFVVDSWATHRLNNYLIFENTFRNLLREQSLYAFYPQYHGDVNHYGPIFSVLIFPFALLPNWLGLLFWNLFNCFLLFKAIQTLPLSESKRVVIGYIAIPCLVASMLNQQFNAGAGAIMILSYTQFEKRNGFWSAMCIAFGTFVKLYGVVGIVVFFFINKKPAFIGYLVFWSVVFFVLPMIFASPGFVAHSYIDWKNELVNKNIANIAGAATDISIMGFFRRLLHYPGLSNIMFLAVGALLFMFPFAFLSRFSKRKFQLLILSSVLLFPVLFSTGSEDCTYIISIAGVGIWYVLEKNKGLKHVLLPILLVITCNIPLLCFPHFAKANPLSLSMLSFPYFLVWLRVLFNAVKYQHEFAEEVDAGILPQLAE